MTTNIPHALLGVTPIADTPWLVISPLALRTTGFPASLLSELSSARLGELAAGAGRSPGNAEAFAAYFNSELRRSALAMARIVGMEPFREALAWQNPATLQTFDSLCRKIDVPGRNAKRRDREYRLLRYISRYCAKTETIGFFGPLGWGTTTDHDIHLRQEPHEPLISHRRTFAEAWAVREIGLALQDDITVLEWLPLRRPAYYSLRDGRLLRPRKEPLPLSDLELAILLLCDGSTPRRHIVTVVSESAGISRETVQECVSELEARRLVIGGANLPLGPASLDILEKRISAIGDDDVARTARDRVEPFLASFRALAKSHGSSAAVVTAQAQLATAFEAITGAAAARKSGMMYAGRGLAYEECLRNVDVELGDSFMKRLSQALPAVLAISQWVTWATASAYEEHFRRRWAAAPRRLDEVWFDVLAAFYGSRQRPVDDVLAEFRQRWNRMLHELGRPASGAWEIDAAQFLQAATKHFDSPRPGWKAAAIHSPDLQICLHSKDGLETGDYSIVLGEIHVGTSTVTGPIFEWPFDGYAISHFLGTFIGKRFAPVFPDTWGRNTGRSIPSQPIAGDVLYAFADVEGVPPEALSVSDISVAVIDDAVVACLPDGTHADFCEFFSFFLASLTIDAWKSLGDLTHTPRISVGGITLLRESWRADLAAEKFTKPASEASSYLAAQEWRRGLGLPGKVYIKLSGEVKPVYVDFNSPLTVLAFLVDLRASLRKSANAGEAFISEALPSPDEAWVVDTQGNEYLGEIRMMVMNGDFVKNV